MGNETRRPEKPLATLEGEPCATRGAKPSRAASPCPRRISDALGATLDPKARAFADHLATAVAASVLRDIRAGRWSTLRAEEEGEGVGP